MDRIVESKIRDRALNQARTEQVEAIQMQRMEVFHTCMRMTAGVAFNAGVVDLSDGRIHERVLELTRNREQAELQAIEKRKQQYENAKNKVNAIREKKVAIQINGMLRSCKRWSPGSSDLVTVTFQKERSNYFKGTYLPAIGLSWNQNEKKIMSQQ